MKVLYYRGFNINLEDGKATSPNEYSVFGTQVYASQVVHALLEYGNFDLYLFPRPAYKSRRVLNNSVTKTAGSTTVTSGGRVGYLNERIPQALRQFRDLVLFAPHDDIRPLSLLRSQIQRPDAVVSGVIHSLNPVETFDQAALQLVSSLFQWDCIFASSYAGMVAYERKREYVRASINIAPGSPPPRPPSVCCVPIGIALEGHDVPSDTEKEYRKREMGLREGTKVLLYFGRLAPGSKCDLVPLLLAVAELASVNRNIALVIAGDDTFVGYSSTLQGVIECLGLGHIVTLIRNPTFEERRRLYTLADIFVSPSDNTQETFGITLLEAMRCALPVVASDWSGYREIVIDGETGFLVPTCMPVYDSGIRDISNPGTMASDDFLARTTRLDLGILVESLNKLIEDEALRKRFGMRGRRVIEEKFTWRKVVSQYEAAWSSMLLMSAEHKHASSVVRPDFASYQPDQIFGHYASSLVLSTGRYVLGERFVALYERQAWLDFVAVPPEWFDRNLLSSLLDRAGLTPMGLKELSDGLSTSHLESALYPLSRDSIIFAHLNRLVKYGMMLNVSECPA